MKFHQLTLVNRAAKMLAGPLSHLVANPATRGLSRLLETYLSILLGKGAGTGWAMDAEIRAARVSIHRAVPVVLDVGANTGEWSARLLQYFPQARLFMIEPQPACQTEIRQRQLAGSVLIPKAVSDQGGQRIRLFTNGDTSGIASLHERRDSCFEGLEFAPLDVETVTVDQVIDEHGLEVVDFMKMDIEGHELHALRGASRSLRDGKIRALTFEFGSSNINSRSYFRDFWDLLTPHGYRLYRILPSARLMPIHEYYEDCEYFRGVTNYLARR